jgi:hypothetical protein
MTIIIIIIGCIDKNAQHTPNPPQTHHKPTHPHQKKKKKHKKKKKKKERSQKILLCSRASSLEIPNAIQNVLIVQLYTYVNFCTNR